MAVDVMFAIEVLVEARRAKRYGMSLRTAAAPLALFSIAYVLMGLGAAAVAQFNTAFSSPSTSRVLPFLSAARAAALLAGFKLYFSWAARASPELQLFGQRSWRRLS